MGCLTKVGCTKGPTYIVSCHTHKLTASMRSLQCSLRLPKKPFGYLRNHLVSMVLFLLRSSMEVSVSTVTRTRCRVTSCK